MANFNKSYGRENKQMFKGKNPELGQREIEMTEHFVQDSTMYNFVNTCPKFLKSK